MSLRCHFVHSVVVVRLITTISKPNKIVFKCCIKTPRHMGLLHSKQCTLHRQLLHYQAEGIAHNLHCIELHCSLPVLHFLPLVMVVMYVLYTLSLSFYISVGHSNVRGRSECSAASMAVMHYFLWCVLRHNGYSLYRKSFRVQQHFF